MYGTPRTATVKAVGACELWQISRRVYRQIELHYKVGRLARRVERVAEVTISDGTKAAKLSSVLARGELEHLADALDEESFDQGAIITRQGEEGDYFYIIEEGDVEVHIDRAAPPYARPETQQARRRDTIRGTTRVKTLSAGDIFGENETRRSRRAARRRKREAEARKRRPPPLSPLPSLAPSRARRREGAHQGRRALGEHRRAVGARARAHARARGLHVDPRLGR